MKFHPLARRRMIALIVLILSSIIFWGLYFQLYFSMNLFINRAVDRHLFGIDVPAVVYIGCESVFVILLGGPIALLWKYLHKRKKNPSIPMKFTLAMFATALSTATFVLAIHLPGPNGLIHSAWIVLAYLFLTVGELLLSPIGLSMVTALAPPHMTGMLMGTWFFALGIGGALAGILAQEANVPKTIMQIANIDHIYSHAFFDYTLYALLATIVLLVLTPWLKRNVGL